MTDTLQDLLARAIELEEKAADVLDRDFTPDARQDYESLAEEPPAEVVAELAARIEALHSRIDAATTAGPVDDEASEVPGAPDEDDDELGEVDEKAWAELDEASLAAYELAEKADDLDDEPAGMDFDEPDDEVKADIGEPDELDAWADAEPEVKSLGDTDLISEFELLRARRTELGL